MSVESEFRVSGEGRRMSKLGGPVSRWRFDLERPVEKIGKGHEVNR